MKNALIRISAPARERGFLLIAAVLLIVVGAVMASTMAFLAVSGSQSSSSHVGSNQALFIADSGLERALYGFNKEGAACAALTYSANVGTGSFSTTGTAYNPISTTLSAAISSTAATIPVASVVGYAPFGRVTIGSERINYAKTSTVAANCAPASAPCFIGARRGVAGTTPAAHSAGAAVAQGLCLVQSIGSVSATGAQRRVQAATEGGSAPIGFNTSTSGTATLSTATSMTWTINVGVGGANRILIVGLSFERGNVTGVGVTATSGGGPPRTLTQIIGAGSGGGNPRAELWYLVNPGTGVNTITALWTGGSKAVGGAASFTGVDQTTPIGVSGGATGKSTNPSVTITTVTSNAWIVDRLAWEAPGATATMVGAVNRLELVPWNVRTGPIAGDVAGAGSHLGPVTTPANVTMDWTFPLTSNPKWAIVATSLRPAGAGGAVSVWQERF